MQHEASFIIRELKQLLKHRKYKYVVSRIERLLQKQEEFEQFCIEFHLNIRFLQLSAINKLFERNLIKKYKYSLHIIDFMVELALRNLGYCHQALREKIKEKVLFNRFNFNHTDHTLTANSFDNFCSNQTHSRNYSIKVSNGLETQEQLKKYLMKFFDVCNKSILMITQSFLVYKLEANECVLRDFIKNQSEGGLKSVSGEMSLIGVNLLYAKSLFLSSDTEDHIKCEEAVEETIEKLIDVMHHTNIVLSKISKSKEEAKKVSKYEKSLGQCQKMMVIALVLANKTKMKLGKETMAVVGIQLFQSYLQGLPSHHKNFRRLMLPELYLQDQFLRYRAQKSELVEIITPFFAEKVKQIQQTNKQRQCSKNRLMDFYNKRTFKIAEKSAPKANNKSLLADINTVKSLVLTGKHKNVSIQSKATKENPSFDVKGKIITNMILSDIQELNANYMKFRKAPTPCSSKKKESMKSYFYKNNSQNVLKKQAISSRTGRSDNLEKENDDQRTQRQREFFLQEATYKTFVSHQKDCLIRRKKENKLGIVENQLDTKQELMKIQEALASPHLSLSFKYTEEKSVEIDEREMRRNVLITSKKKTQLFIEILFQNKELLGIKKIAQKVESLRKKQQEKMKSMNNRLTSSINQKPSRGSFVKFEVIAKQIIRKHISFSNDKSNLPKTPNDSQQARKKLIQASYTLGQRSIEAVKEKLECKINKNEYSVDKYLKNEQIFKLKLKKLGTTNFILKKTNQQKEPSDVE